ncbi:PqiC family protein (plasmid) [Paracoccus sp. TK19116]|uniref:PqiC family protein n=1 Tax=Paracoccus albicereus TaxID=2922394 RepID=A0ABT1MM23_9RHOB|nr:PqiC family protein [Paracoccus albicereus]MCQ0969343.1 PqiC family protein [Paracoccus albicereus]
MTLTKRIALPSALLLTFSLLAACSDPEDTARYLIDPPVAPTQVANRLGTAELVDVSLPEYASGQEVSYQTADGAVRSNPDNLWADNPQRGFTLSLARAISDVSGATVIAEPWPLTNPPDRKLDVRVEKALAQADGVYRLTGRYFVSDETYSSGGNHARSFDISVPLGGEGTGFVAAAQSTAISILAQQIAVLGGPGSTFVAKAPAADEFGLPPLLPLDDGTGI